MMKYFQSPLLAESPDWSDFPVGSHEKRTGRRKKLRRGRGRVRRSLSGQEEEEEEKEEEMEKDDIEERSDLDIAEDEDLPVKIHNERSAVYPHSTGYIFTYIVP